MKAFSTLAALLFIIGCCIFGAVACTAQKVVVPIHGQRTVRFTKMHTWKETIEPVRSTEVTSFNRIDTIICITTVNRECTEDNSIGKHKYSYWQDESSEIEYRDNKITAYTIYTSDTTGITYYGVK